MDNVSHTVVGFLAGEIIHRSLPDEADPELNAKRRALLLVSCFVASNFPDLDLVLTPLLPQPLGYLLHHRGHTHTILYAFPQALLLLGVLWLLWPSARQVLKQSKLARRGLAIGLGVGFSLHMLMDYLNSYGVHPFHPLDSRWFFGDMVFIIEPLFWVAFGIPMAMMVKRRWLKALWTLFLVGIPLGFTVIGFLPWISFLALSVTALGLAWLQVRSGPKKTTALICAAMVGISFVALQSYSSGLAKRAVRDALALQDPSSRFLDSAMASYPTNPLCWGFVSIEKNESAGTFRLRRGLLSLAPGVMPVASCPSLLAEREEQREISPGLAFTDESSGSLEQLRTLARDNCHFNAWMRFARAPLVTEAQALDLRFKTRGPRGNFTVLNFEDFKGRECSDLIPQWSKPREDLLGP